MSGIDEFTKLLFHFEDFSDSSLSPQTVSDAGSVISVGGKFGSCVTMSQYDGELVIPYASDLVIGSQDFTVDFWVKNMPPGHNYEGFIFLENDAYGLRIEIPSDGTHVPTFNCLIAAFYDGNFQLVSATWPLSTNYHDWTVGEPWYSYDWIIDPAAWNHIAVTGSGQFLELFINGVSQGAVDTGHAYDNYSVIDWDNYPVGKVNTSDLVIYGTQWYEVDVGYPQIDEFRYSIGIRRWTSNFTPPTEAYSYTRPIQPIELLLHCNGSNAGVSFPDSSPVNHTVVPTGAAQTATATPKFGSASVKFGTNGDSLSIATCDLWPLLKSDFTVHFWVKIADNFVDEQELFSQYTDADNFIKCTYSTITQILTFKVVLGSEVKMWVSTSVALPVNVWTHVAIVGTGSTNV